jgi:uncharacterized protein YdhG (YjbR/CyaY superfamily)
MTEANSATAEIDAMLAAAPEDQRAALQKLRETIAAAAPGAIETISYGMPAFRYRNHALVSFASFKAHCSFFPMSAALMDRMADELRDFRTAKGTLRFTPDRPIPTELVERIVRERIAQIDRD